MKITINSKELKALLEKVTPVIPKKTQFSILESVLLTSKNGILSATTTNITQFLTVTTKEYTTTTDGSILIGSNDVLILTKLSGDITIESTEETKAVIRSNKKSISISLKDTEDFPKLPENTEENENVIVKEYDFLKVISKLIVFTSSSESNEKMQYYNMNVTDGYIEAIDGHRIGINNIDMKVNSKNSLPSILIHNSINKNLKKVLSSKSTTDISITISDGFIFFKGKDFMYIDHHNAGEYFKTQQMFFDDYDFKIELETSGLMEISKFNVDMVKFDAMDKRPMILYYNNETKENYIYMNTGKHITTDKLELIKSEMPNKDICMGFNPLFILDALKCIDESKVTIIGSTSKAPITIIGTDEKYLILPVNIGQNEAEIINYMKDAA